MELNLEIAQLVQSKINFANTLINRMMQKNILEGMFNVEQSLWVHHRLRKLDYTLSDETVIQLDVINLGFTGTLETTDFALAQMTPDDMTKSYHWLTQDRINWIRNQIREHLGWPPV